MTRSPAPLSRPPGDPGGRRIVIYGATGSGKTSLGRRLAETLGLHHIELDALYHGPNWTPTPPEEFLAKIQDAIDARPNGWVADGNYGVARGLLLPLSDTVVWLRPPWRVSYLRMLRRTFGRMLRGKELWNGNKETLRGTFLDKKSLLVWGILQHKPSQERITGGLQAIEHRAEVFEVRSTKALDALVRRFLDEAKGEVRHVATDIESRG